MSDTPTDELEQTSDEDQAMMEEWDNMADDAEGGGGDAVPVSPP